MKCKVISDHEIVPPPSSCIDSTDRGTCALDPPTLIALRRTVRVRVLSARCEILWSRGCPICSHQYPNLRRAQSTHSNGLPNPSARNRSLAHEIDQMAKRVSVNPLRKIKHFCSS